MSQTSPLDASINLPFEAAATGSQVLLVDADTYGGAVAQAPSKNAIGRQGRRERTGTGKTTLLIFGEERQLAVPAPARIGGTTAGAWPAQVGRTGKS